MSTEGLRKMLEGEEGRRRTVYKDSMGIATIGVGRNLEGKGLDDSEINYLLENDIIDVYEDAKRMHPWILELSEPRRDALLAMLFQLGLNKFSQFQLMLAAARAGHWDEAARQLLDSTFAKQVPARAGRLRLQLISDTYQFVP